MSITVLGSLPAKDLAFWMYRTLAESPAVQSLLADPQGYVTRVGEAIVWDGPAGQQVIAGLHGIQESQSRIEQAISAVEAAQISTAGTLGALQAVSIATLGVSSLAAGCMLWRLHALNKRLSLLQTSIQDIEEHLSAQDKAHLRQGISKLQEFETGHDPDDLKAGRDASQYAAHLYGQLAHDEAVGQRRLPVLNYRARCYHLALLSEIRARLLLDAGGEVVRRIAEERDFLTAIAQATFERAVGDSPEQFLDPALATEGITLDLLADLYQQAEAAQAVGDVHVRTASEMFEHVRGGFTPIRHLTRWTWSLAGQARKDCLGRLRYLMACLEDTNRIHGIRLLIETTREARTTLESIAEQVEAWRQERLKGARADLGMVVAYAIA